MNFKQLDPIILKERQLAIEKLSYEIWPHKDYENLFIATCMNTGHSACGSSQKTALDNLKTQLLFELNIQNLAQLLDLNFDKKKKCFDKPIFCGSGIHSLI